MKMDEKKNICVYQTVGDSPGCASKKLSILKQPKRIPLQPLFIDASEDNDTTVTTTMTSHQRKVSFSVGTQIKEFHNDTEGISEGWGSSYEESLKSDSTRSSESNSSGSIHHSSSVSVPEAVGKAGLFKLSTIHGSESVMSKIPILTERPSLASVNRLEISYQGKKMKTCEKSDSVLHVDRVVKYSASEVVHIRGSRRSLLPCNSDAADHCISDHILQSQSHVLDHSDDSSGLSVNKFTVAEKPRSCLLSPSLKYSQRVVQMLENVDPCDELNSFEKPVHVMPETCSALPYVSNCSFLGENFRIKNNFQSSRKYSEPDIFFPIPCNTSRVQLDCPSLSTTRKENLTDHNDCITFYGRTDALQSIQDCNISQSRVESGEITRNMNRTEDSFSMELTDVLPVSQVCVPCTKTDTSRDEFMEMTDVLPVSQVRVHYMETDATLGDCMELTEVLPVSQVHIHCRESVATQGECMELTEPIHSDVISGITSQGELDKCINVPGSLQSGENVVKQCNTEVNNFSMELTDVIGSVPANDRTHEGSTWYNQHNLVNSPEVSQLSKVGSPLAHVIKDNNVTVGGKFEDSSPQSEKLSSGNVCAILLSHDHDSLPNMGSIVNLLKDTKSSTTVNNCFQGKSEGSLASTCGSVGVQLSGLQISEKGLVSKLPGLDSDSACTVSEDNGNESEFARDKGRFKRQNTDVSSKLPRKKFLAAMQTEVNPVASKVLTTESSLSFCEDDGLRHDKSSLQLDYSTIWQSHASQNDTNCDDNTSRLLAAKICIDSLEHSIESSNIHSIGTPIRRCSASILVEDKCEDHVETLINKGLITTPVAAVLDSDLDHQSIREDKSLHYKICDNICDNDEIQIFKAAKTSTSFESPIENSKLDNPSEVHSENLNNGKEVVLTDSEFNSHNSSVNYKSNDSLDYMNERKTLNTALECSNAKLESENNLSCKDEIIHLQDANLTNLLTDSQSSSVCNQDKKLTLCSALECNSISGYEREINCGNNVSFFDSKCDNTSGGKNHSSMVGDVSGCLLSHDNENSCLADGEYYKTTDISLTFKDVIVLKDDIKNTGESLLIDTCCTSLYDLDNQSQNSERGYCAKTALRNENELKCKDFLASTKIECDNTEKENNGSFRFAQGGEKLPQIDCNDCSESKECEDFQLQNLLLPEVFLSKKCSPHVSTNLCSIEGNVVENLSVDFEAVPSNVNAESFSRCEKSSVSMVVDSDMLDNDKGSLNIGAGNVIALPCIPRQEQNDGNGTNVDTVSERSCDSTASNVKGTYSYENNNVCICDSSVMEDFDIGQSPDQRTLMSDNCSTENEMINDKNRHDCSKNVASYDRKNNTGFIKASAEMDIREGSSLIVEDIYTSATLDKSDLPSCAESAAVVDFEKQSNTVIQEDKMQFTNDEAFGSCCDYSMHLRESDCISDVTLNNTNTAGTFSMSSHECCWIPRPSQSVKDFLNEFSESDDCVWTIKTLDEEEWVFQFLFSSLELVLKLATEGLEKASEYRTITDVYFNSRITEKTDALAHLVHHMIMKQYTGDVLKSLCCTTEYVPRILHSLSIEVDNMTWFMLEFDKLERTGRLTLKEKCLTMRISDLELNLLFDVAVDLTCWGNISQTDVSVTAAVGLIREDDVQRLVCTVVQDKSFLSQYILAIDEYLRHLATCDKLR